MRPAVEPVVTAAAVMSTVAGEHTAAGLVTVTVGFGLMVTVTGLISEHPAAVEPLI